jgi:hypothetical protein
MEAPDFDELEWMAQQQESFSLPGAEDQDPMHDDLERYLQEAEAAAAAAAAESMHPPLPTGSFSLPFFFFSFSLRTLLNSSEN